MKSAQHTSAKNQTTFTLMKRLYHEQINQHKGTYLLAILLMIISGAMAGVQAKLIEPAIDLAILKPNLTLLYWFAGAIALASLVKGFSIYGQSLLLTKVGLKIIAKIQNQLIAHLLVAPYSFHQNYHSGGLSARITNDGYALRNSLSRAIVGLVRDGVMVVILLAVMIWQDWFLSLIILTVIPFAIIGAVIIGKKIRVNAQKYQQSVEHLSVQLIETLRAIIPLRLYNALDREQNSVLKLLEKMRGLSVRGSDIRARTYPLFGLVHGVAIASIFIIAAGQIADERMTVGGLMSFITALMMAIRPMQGLAQINATLQEGLAAYVRMNDLIDRKWDDWDDNKDTAAQAITLDLITPDPITPNQGHNGKVKLDINDLNYSAPHQDIEEQPSDGGKGFQLHNISFSLNSDDDGFYALCGASGAGKSTLLLCLTGLLKTSPSSDSAQIPIQLNDKPMPFGLRGDSLAFVGQHPRLFNQSFLDNICYGTKRKDEKTALNAAHQAGLKEILPDETSLLKPIGEMAAFISGGQKSKLAIARAIYNQKPIWFMDEPAAGLDQKSELELLELIEGLSKNRIIILSTHRIMTAKKASKILFLENGCLIDFAPPEKLKKKLS